MTYATRSPLHVRTPSRRNLSSTNKWIVRNALTRGLAAVVIGCGTIASVMIGTGWLFAVSFKAHSDTRSIVALASAPGKLTGVALAKGSERAHPTAIAIFSPSEAELPLKPIAVKTVSVPNLVNRRALVVASASVTRNEPSDDPDYTGSLGTDSPKLAPAVIASAGPVEISSARDKAQSPPLPRARPRLASLSPVDLGIKPEEDSGSLKTAIYDITAQTVYLPNGERLEAHSGLGSFMDDPRYVHTRMRGATPPNTYRLTLRESLFHGVQALRLTPVNDEKMFGRAGMLAHTYMLGPNGQSNGCVSFKNYPRFLQAYQRGEIDRMVVVSRLDSPPKFFATRTKVHSAENTY